MSLQAEQMACGEAKQCDLNDRIINIESQSENQLLATVFFRSLLGKHLSLYRRIQVGDAGGPLRGAERLLGERVGINFL